MLRLISDFIGLIQRPCLTKHSTFLHSLLRAECTKLINLRHDSSYIGMESAIRYTMLLNVSTCKPHTPVHAFPPSHTQTAYLTIIQVPQLRAVTTIEQYAVNNSLQLTSESSLAKRQHIVYLTDKAIFSFRNINTRPPI